MKPTSPPNDTSRMPSREASRTGENVPPLVGMDASQTNVISPSIKDNTERNRILLSMF
jgi:hypothetical protein